MLMLLVRNYRHREQYWPPFPEESWLMLMTFHRFCCHSAEQFVADADDATLAWALLVNNAWVMVMNACTDRSWKVQEAVPRSQLPSDLLTTRIC